MKMRAVFGRSFGCSVLAYIAFAAFLYPWSEMGARDFNIAGGLWMLSIGGCFLVWLPVSISLSLLLAAFIGEDPKSTLSTEHVVADEHDEPEKEPRLWVILLLAVVAVIVVVVLGH